MDLGFLYITLLGAHRDVFGWCSCLDELRIALGGCIVTMWVPLVRPSPLIGCLNRQPVAGDWWIWASHVFAWRLLWCGMRIVLIWALSGHVLVCLAVLTLFSSLFYRGMVMGRVHRSHCLIISYIGLLFFIRVFTHVCLLILEWLDFVDWLIDLLVDHFIGIAASSRTCVSEIMHQ